MLYIYIYIYSVLFFLHNCPLLIPLHNTAVLIKICRFLINVVKFTQTLMKLDLPTLRKGSTEERTLAGSRTQVPGFSSADAITTKPRVPVAGTEFLSV